MTRQLFLAAALLMSSFCLATTIQFGDNTSANANNGICDDPRFEGDKTNSDPQVIDRYHDASDCRTLFNNEEIQLAGTDGIDFGNDSGNYPNDGECDDSRFTGPGTGIAGTPGTDATDCLTLYLAGEVSLPEPAEPVALYLPDGSINFGDNSGSSVDDGWCDDPRFDGPKAYNSSNFSNVGGDRNDCEAAYRGGELFFKAGIDENWRNRDDSIDFGTDSGSYVNDYSCNDSRFTGYLMGARSSEQADATDCRALYMSGLITLYVEPELYLADGSINFGDNSSNYANDNECDDARFTGPGHSGTNSQDHIARDQRDCESAYRAGTIFVKAELPESGEYEGIDFGDNSSSYAFDYECDDSRFDGPGTSGLSSSAHVRRDASDCIQGLRAGTVFLDETDTAIYEPVSFDDIDFGDNSSNYAYDNDCDDPRFEGPNATGLSSRHIKADADDCLASYLAGTVTFVGAAGGTDTPSSEPVSFDGIDFGDNSSIYAYDIDCDDPRFEGPNATGLSSDHIKADADDCLSAYQAGTVTLIGAAFDHIDFGTDDSMYAFDGECDDPRFEGPGAAYNPSDEHLYRDAFDCRSLLAEGRVSMIGQQGKGASTSDDNDSDIAFGDDSSIWANDGVCDDPRFRGEGMAASTNEVNIRRDASDCQAAYNDGTIELN